MHYVLRISLVVLIFPMVVQSTRKSLVFLPKRSIQQSGNNSLLILGNDKKRNLLGITEGGEVVPIGSPEKWNPIKGHNIKNIVITNGNVHGDPGGKVFVNDSNGNDGLILTIVFRFDVTKVTTLDRGQRAILDTRNARNAVVGGNKAVLVEYNLTSAFNRVWNVNLYELPFPEPKKSWWKNLLSCCKSFKSIESKNIYTSNEKIGPLALNKESTKLFFGVNGNLYSVDLADNNQKVHKLLQAKNKITSIVIPNAKQVIYGTTEPSVIIANIVNGSVIAQLLGNTFPITALVVGKSSKYGSIIAALGQKRKQNKVINSEVCIWKNILPELNDHLMRQKISDDENINKQFGNFTVAPAKNFSR
jgi:hypothetical protein